MNDNIGILDPNGINTNPLTGKEYSDNYKKLAKIWSKFPAYQNAKQIIKDIVNHNVLLVVSGTGSGKTVLFPKYVLHALNYNAKIAITLPKQLIAKSSAEFSADTLDVTIGKHVGYQYRGSGKKSHSSDTKLLYCTDGTLVARLMTNPLLEEFDAVLIDEAHERKVNIDFLLYLLKNVLKTRENFKLIIMSATINESIFRDYYRDFSYKSISIGAKTNYPIKSVFLKTDVNIYENEYLEEGIRLIVKLLGEFDPVGILFFVTSISETNDMCELLAKKVPYFKDKNVCVSVYSGMNVEQQKIAIDKDYYKEFVKNGTKIIISTNVAESSLTIEGIDYVIDSGLELATRYDPETRINILEKKIITQAQVKQRMGRTGRTGAGTCYHLYTEETFKKMSEFPEPSIRTESISYEITRLLNTQHINNINELTTTLESFIQPPRKEYVKRELAYLRNLGLLTDITNNGELTKIGKDVATLQMQMEDALSLIMAYRLNCFREVASILAMIDIINANISQLFILPTDANIQEIDDNVEKRRKLVSKFEDSKKHFDNKYGDHIALLKIFGEYEKKRGTPEKLREWCYKYFIKQSILDKSYKRYEQLKRRYRNVIKNMNYEKGNNKIQSVNLKYKIIASLLFGYKMNILDIKEKSQINTIDGNVKNIQLEKFTFFKKDNKKSVKLFYNKLFRFGKSKVTAKIITRISKKSHDLLNEMT